ncbi:MAG: hypothetical protein NNA23_09295 [Nitrospira sp.]|nr:hypothetical protein [Nitrospira sp.]MCP9465300.1 hypothetical protein [Nitrospira sp.]
MNVRLTRLTSLLILAIILLSGGPAWAKWIALDKQYQPQGKQTFYYDPQTIQQKGNWVTIWQLTDIKWMGESPTPRFLSATTHKQFDCLGWRVRILQVVEFSRNMGAGKSRSGYIENGNWQRIEPQSADHGLARIVCRKP